MHDEQEGQTTTAIPRGAMTHFLLYEAAQKYKHAQIQFHSQ